MNTRYRTKKKPENIRDRRKRFRRQLSWLGFLLCLFLSGSLTGPFGCGKPGQSENNYTNSFVTISSINDNVPLQSDVLTDGYGTDDVVTIDFKSEFRVPDDDPTAPDGPSVFDTISFYSYHVTHQRSDGGPNPADFPAGVTLTIPPNSDSVSVDIVIVRAFDKHRSPLEELRDDGEIFTTSIITFYGEDGYGNDVAVSGSLAISFANFPDQ